MNLILKALRDQCADVSTQEVFADRTGFTQSKVAAMEGGSRPVQADDLETWARGLGVNGEILKQFHRALEGYLWSSEKGEYWWKDLATEAENELFNSNPTIQLDEDELENYWSDQADNWFEYTRERYLNYVQSLAVELFANTNAQLSIIENYDLTRPLETEQFKLRIELAPKTERQRSKEIWVDVEPPWQTPSEKLKSLINMNVDKKIISKYMGEALTDKEFRKVAAYVNGLLDSRRTL